jgi:hypothetical protein
MDKFTFALFVKKNGHLIKFLSALDLSNLTSTICIIIVIVSSDLKSIFLKQYLKMFIICLNAKLNVPSSNGLCVSATKPKAKETFRTVAML